MPIAPMDAQSSAPAERYVYSTHGKLIFRSRGAICVHQVKSEKPNTHGKHLYPTLYPFRSTQPTEVPKLTPMR